MFLRTTYLKKLLGFVNATLFLHNCRTEKAVRVERLVICFVFLFNTLIEYEVPINIFYIISLQKFISSDKLNHNTQQR